MPQLRPVKKLTVKKKAVISDVLVLSLDVPRIKMLVTVRLGA